MCVGVPEQILRCEGLVGHAKTGRLIDMTLTGPVPPETWVLTHLGSARETISADEAALISTALEGLSRVMSGDALGDAFADLDARAPSLPPHLEAARLAGKATA